MMTDLMLKVILKKYPDFDPERYSYKSGDIVRTLDGAKILVEGSAIDFVIAYVIRPGLKYRDCVEAHVLYDDLPYYKKGSEVLCPVPVLRGYHWDVGKFVIDPITGMTLYLYEEQGHQAYYAYVLDCAGNSYYEHTHIYVVNPYKDYIKII